MTSDEFLAAALKAFIDRDRPALERALHALLHPDYASFTRTRLEEHRNDLHVRLAAVNDHLQHHIQTARGELRQQYAAAQAASSIDPSDPLT